MSWSGTVSDQTIVRLGVLKGPTALVSGVPSLNLTYIIQLESVTLPFQFSFSTFNFHRHHHQHLCNSIFLFCEQREREREREREKRFAKAKVIPPTLSSGKPIYLSMTLFSFLLYDMLIQSRLCNRVSQNCFCCFHESQHIKDDCNIFVSYIYIYI